MLGLRSTEARVMVALLAAGSGTAATLSRLARMPRPAMYAVLDSLENLGLAVALGREGSHLELPRAGPGAGAAAHAPG